MHIESLITNKRTLCHAECCSKKRTLQTLSELIAEGAENIDANDLFQQLVAREKLGSTGLGGGIAIPHCRYRTEGKVLGALMTLKDPIDFDSVDSEPVDIVFAMLVPDNADNEHLQNLAVLAERLQDKKFVESLRKATNQKELFQAALT